MDIKIINSVENAYEAKGLSVIIDVFRAFSTECFVFNNGAKYIIPAIDLGVARQLKKENPEFVLMGEREGLRPLGFDYGNSPTEIENVDFKNKIIVHTTSNGTKGLVNSVNAQQVLTGSFVNAQAIVDYILKENPEVVSLVSTSPHVSDEKNEDLMLAYFIRDSLNKRIIDENEIKEMLVKTSAYSKLFKEIGVPKTDFELCLDFNRFNFVIKQEVIDERKVLVKVVA